MEFIDRSDGCERPSTYHFVCESGHCIELKTGCHSRFNCQCPVCSRKWAALVRKKFAMAILDMKSPAFMTLTLTKRRSVHENLDRIWDLRRALFKRLRREGYRIGSWVGVVELPNHIHLVVDTDYIPQKKISTIWKALSGDSYIVDIRRIKGPRGPRIMAAYLAKYITKALGFCDLPSAELKGFHVVQSYGVRAVKREPMKCPCCGLPVRFASLEEYLALVDYEERAGLSRPSEGD